MHVGDDLLRLLLRDPVHLVDPGPRALGPVIPEERGLVLTTVQEVDGALHHGDGPLGDVVGDVGEVGRGEGEAAVKRFRRSELLNEPHSGRKINHRVFSVCFSVENLSSPPIAAMLSRSVHTY